MNKRPIIFFDMDNTIVNFDSSRHIPADEKHIYNHPKMYTPGFFLELEPIEGMVEFVRALIREGYWDVQILTQPVAASSNSYSEKVQWIMKYLPELTDKITMTQDKLMVKGTVLVDDSEKWQDFSGHFILFNYHIPELSLRALKQKLLSLKTYL